MRRRNQFKHLIAILSVLALLAAACGDDGDDAAVTETTTATTATPSETPDDTMDDMDDTMDDGDMEEVDDAMALPGEGVSVTIARANWSTGYMQAAIFAALLTELGYTVSDPADLELAPSNAFVAMANGEFDFWANSWFPNHDAFLDGEMPDGSLVREHVTSLGLEMPRSGVQGLITNKAFADANRMTGLWMR